VAVISDQDRDRQTLSTLAVIGMIIGSALFGALGIPIVNLFSSEAQGYLSLIVIAFVFGSLASVLGGLGITERVKPAEDEEGRYTLRDTFLILTRRPVLALFLQSLLKSIGQYVGLTVMIFFYQYVLLREDLFALLGIATLVGMLGGLILAQWLLRKFGKKYVMSISIVMVFLAAIIPLFVPRSQPVIFVLISFLFSAHNGLGAVTAPLINADNMDYIEWELGYRAEGAVASLYTFLVKTGQGVGAGLAGLLLAAINYVPNAIQTDEVVRGLYRITFGVPAAMAVIAFFVWQFGYPFTSVMLEKMNIDLKQRRES
jgi:GPH family glycoside/pentoside/hexuronide:cation symporter/glucuronide carrier protein